MVLGFRVASRARRPHPFDAIYSGVGIMLGYGADENGRPSKQFVISETEDFSKVAPTSYQFGADPEGNPTAPYGRFPKGFGLPQEGEEPVSGAYDHTINALVYGQSWNNGPDITTFTPATVDATNGVTAGYDLNSESYDLNGRYVRYRVSDSSWLVSKDFIGGVGVDACTFYSPALSQTRSLVAMGDSVDVWMHTGATVTTVWSQITSLKALCFASGTSDLYRAYDTNMLSKLDRNADPTDINNWRDIGRIGDKSCAIVRMAYDASGVLVIVKTDGIYSADASGRDVKYFPFLEPVPSASHGKGLGGFLNDIFIPMGRLAKLSPGFSIDPERSGPEAQNRTDWLASMRTTAFLGHGALFGLGAVTDETDSYLMLMTPDGVWHGSISVKFANKLITSLSKSTKGAPTNHHRLNIGFSDGSKGWCSLPNTFDWSADTACTFSTTDGELYTAIFTSTIPNDPKALYAITVNGPNLTSARYAQVEYMTDPAAGAWTALGNDFDSVRERAAFPNNTSGVLIRFKVLLKNTVNTSTPKVTGMGIHHAWRIPRREVYSFYVLCADNLWRHDNTPLRIGRTKITQVVEAGRDSQGSITLILPDHSSQQVSVKRIEQGQRAFDSRTGQWRSAIKVVAVQFSENVIYGTYQRLTPYTYGQITSYTYTQLQHL